MHKFDFLFKQDVLGAAAPGATVLLNSPYGPDAVWDELPRKVQQQIIDKRLKLYVIDASKVAFDLGLGARSNTILQTCFFALSGVLPRDEAIAAIKKETERTYARKGAEVVKKNFAAIDSALANLQRSDGADHRHRQARDLQDGAGHRARVRAQRHRRHDGRPRRHVAGQRDSDRRHVPHRNDASYEKRNIAEEVPIWEPDLCIQCGQCAIVCPHSVIRAKYYDRARLADAPAAFKAVPINARGYPDSRYTLQVYVEDCTGCGVCVENCPAHSPDDDTIKAINMKPRLEHMDVELASIAFFEKLPWADRTRVNFANVRGVQFMQPLFEFSGACAGCGETPYLKLLSQLFGDRLQIANATGCSSIYGGNLPTTPWARRSRGRGPAWANSLFEDNAEFGLGYRIAIDKQAEIARGLALKLAPKHRRGSGAPRLLEAPQITESDFRLQRERVAALKAKLAAMSDAEARESARPCRLSRPPLGVDRRRRRMGVRHRLRRPRPRARLRPQRQRAGARHRGLLQHRWSGVEGDAARRVGQVRRRRQEGAAQGPRDDGDLLRQRLRRAGRHGREQRAGGHRISRSRGLRRPLADPGLFAMHRARYRHAPRHEAGGARCRERPLAVAPLRPDHAHAAR